VPNLGGKVFVQRLALTAMPTCQGLPFSISKKIWYFIYVCPPILTLKDTSLVGKTKSQKRNGVEIDGIPQLFAQDGELLCSWNRGAGTDHPSTWDR